MSSTSSPAKDSFFSPCYGALFPLAIVLCVAAPPVLHTMVQGIPLWLLYGLDGLCILLVAGLFIGDARSLAKRSREPGFNGWSEI